ncbi:hypothetical protein CDD83_1921 [Cordyceps sp. RAO-2017]|nr:hypothetical protein CDD83_1921 [Cordyceps sp. RAO-2017]
MTASSRGRRAFQNAVLAAASPARVCSRCATTTTTTTTTTSYSRGFFSSPPSSSSSTGGLETASPATGGPSPPAAAAYDVRSGLILTRAPLLTRRLHPFENAFFFYQKRLEERLNSAFVTSIYFKPDTARRMDWNIKVAERQGAVAKELGLYHGKSARAWNDELKVGDPLSSQERLVDSLLRDGEARVSDDAELIPPENVVPVERPLPRETDADRAGDVTRLDRRLDRTLYLVVRGRDGWGFPADSVAHDENLHEAAQRVLDQAAGVNMNTWLVGRAPVAHLVTRAVVGPDGAVHKPGRKTFFLKGRIMAGQADLRGNPFGYSAFKWLTREELEAELAPDYYRGVRNMMGDR